MDATVPTEVPELIRGYRVIDLIGKGAMGAVYRAVVRRGRRGLAKGDSVALKILDRRFTLDRSVVRRFKREAGVGLSAGSHPGIARVYEVGSVGEGDSQVHFIVQELLTGKSLRAILDAAGHLEESFIRDVGLQVAQTLEFVHGKGIVHRDLKPANLFVGEDGLVKLVDFGLARLIQRPGLPASLTDSGVYARTAEGGVVRAETPLASAGSGAVDLLEASTRRGQFVGTVAYAAPEQLRGEPATPRSDLFAVGLVLYEMVSGSHPFAQDLDHGYDAYVLAMESRAAAALTSARPEISYFLERLTQALLEKDPRERLPSATLLSEILREGERSTWWLDATSEQSEWISRSRRRLQVRRKTRVLHRDGEIAALKDLARRTLFGTAGQRDVGGCALIEGEAGIGKTRLLDHLAQWVENLHIHAYQLVLLCSEVEVPSPFFPLRQLVRDAVGLDGDEEYSAAHIATRLERVLPRERRHRDELAHHLAREKERDDTSFEPLIAAYVAFFHHVAREAPTLLVVESAHAADPATLEVILRVLDRSSSVPLLVLLSIRPEEGDAAVHRRLEPLRQKLLRLRPKLLEPEHVRSMLFDLAVDVPDPQLAAQRLHRTTGGNPLFILETVELLRNRGELALLSSADEDIVRLPVSLQGLFEQRLERLDPFDRTVVEAAAVLGVSFRLVVLEHVVGLGKVQFSTAVGRLEQQFVFRIVGAGQARFRHGAFRRFVRERIDVARRMEVHRRAARHYDVEASTPGASPRSALKAAMHADLSADRELLHKYLREGARILSVEGQAENALALVQSAERKARQEPEHAPLLMEALILRGEISHRMGRTERERDAWREAAKVSGRQGDKRMLARALHGMGRFHSRSGTFLVAESELRSAFNAAQSVGAQELFAPIHLDLAECLLWRGDEDGAKELLDRAERWIDPGAQPAVLARYYKERGNLLLELEQFEAAQEAFRLGRAALRSITFRGLQRAMLIGTARLFRELCDFKKARAALEIVIRSARSDRDLRQEAIARYVLAETEARSGDPDSAYPHVVRAIQLARKVNDQYLLVNSLGGLALLYRWERFGRHSPRKAVRWARRAVSFARDLTATRLETRGLAALALCYRDIGRLQWALAITRKAIREAQAAGIKRRRAAEIWYVHALVLQKAGQTGAARTALEQARQFMEERLEKVGSEPLRRHILETDPLFVQIDRSRI